MNEVKDDIPPESECSEYGVREGGKNFDHKKFFGKPLDFPKKVKNLDVTTGSL